LFDNFIICTSYLFLFSMKKFMSKGFTLIELIIVIAVIALLAAATFVAINPAKRVGDAQDAQRWQDATAIADAYQAYLADYAGNLPTTTLPYATGITLSIATTSAGANSSSAAANCVASTAANGANKYIDLSALVTGGYIGQIPTNPSYTSTASSGYYFMREASGRLIIGACTKYGTNYPIVYR
jgi:prepilin-type N-terminal cleavage/methylation domain-containing protein